MNIDEMLRVAVEQGASDVHLKVGIAPYYRINGELMPLPGFPKLTKDDTGNLAAGLMNARQKQIFKDKAEVDLAYALAGMGRFRVNIFQQKGTIALSLRVIPQTILQFQDLYLPPVLSKIAMENRGLVLVTGTTGSGKSTTLACLIDYINQNRNSHIITVEDPVEFVHNDKKSIISQREISLDALSFAAALRSALRQDPDVILVGEMRDLETIETALLAAETGHLVFSTLHTLDAPETINRIVAAFPPHQHQQIRLQLASVLKAVISMRLMRRSDQPGRVPAVEVMLVTEFIRHCITDPMKMKLIKSAIAAGKSQYGMQTFDQSIYDHYSSGLISYEDALMYASNPDEFKLRVEGIYATSEMDAELESEISRFERGA
ncbi:MAG: type IV pilus twitching motility protein PilT [Acidobacteria bacterium]|nr:type IV pilus twitching motility protein PilT [Acidobacteriota bacterium]